MSYVQWGTPFRCNIELGEDYYISSMATHELDLVGEHYRDEGEYLTLELVLSHKIDTAFFSLVELSVRFDLSSYFMKFLPNGRSGWQCTRGDYFSGPDTRKNDRIVGRMLNAKGYRAFFACIVALDFQKMMSKYFGVRAQWVSALSHFLGRKVISDMCSKAGVPRLHFDNEVAMVKNCEMHFIGVGDFRPQGEFLIPKLPKFHDWKSVEENSEKTVMDFAEQYWKPAVSVFDCTLADIRKQDSKGVKSLEGFCANHGLVATDVVGSWRSVANAASNTNWARRRRPAVVTSRPARSAKFRGRRRSID